MVDHGDLGFCVALEDVKNLIILLCNDIFWLKSSKKIKSFIISFKPTEDSKIEKKITHPTEDTDHY